MLRTTHRMLFTRAVAASLGFGSVLLVHIALKYASLNRMRFGPGYMSFESKQYGGQRRPKLLF